MIHKLLPAVLIMIFLSCANNESKGRNASESGIEDSTAISSAEELTGEIAEKRAIVKKEPVAEFSVKTDDPLNDWYFSVRLYETPVTFHYLVKLGFEEIQGEDTLKLPNFGIMPEPVIRKGDEKYSCIIGFMDKEGNFREYKKVHVKGNSLKITALKHYAVSTRVTTEE